MKHGTGDLGCAPLLPGSDKRPAAATMSRRWRRRRLRESSNQSLDTAAGAGPGAGHFGDQFSVPGESTALWF